MMIGRGKTTTSPGFTLTKTPWANAVSDIRRNKMAAAIADVKHFMTASVCPILGRTKHQFLRACVKTPPGCKTRQIEKSSRESGGLIGGAWSLLPSGGVTSLAL